MFVKKKMLGYCADGTNFNVILIDDLCLVLTTELLTWFDEKLKIVCLHISKNKTDFLMTISGQRKKLISGIQR